LVADRYMVVVLRQVTGFGARLQKLPYCAL